MSPRETLGDAMESLAARKLRAALSMLGMIFGVGSVVAMLAIGEGASSEALAMIERLGLRNLVVESEEPHPDDLMEVRKKSPGLSMRDARAIEEAIPGVEAASPRIRVNPYRVSGAKGAVEAVAYGVSRDYLELANFRLKEGRFIDALDEKTHAQVAVVGAGVERSLFGYESGIGRSFKLDSLWLEVIGVFEDDSVGSQEIYLPYSTALRKLDRPPLDSPLDQIVVRLASDVSPWDAATEVAPLLDLHHGGAGDYRIIVPEALLEQSRATKRLFNIVMGAIAGISLLVGGIGIMNIMLASVLERTAEIGIRRAVGARRSDILLQFLVESFSISFIGGSVGIGAGIAIAYLVAFYAEWPTVVTIPSVILATFVSVAVGVLSGFYPALRAADLQPSAALGYE